ncbi:DUF4025 domain-containing protein [Ectobacillus panaciterrae]|uniref:DUF4025 domain-containing protein n=1 Tax=Ectobacillus panaciterrae TaxID=363872 RepID=UPI00041D0078|nr:DUF4025 domain-containing protein [Ectobacillus panaciterrae]
MNKDQYKDPDKLTNFHYGSEKDHETAQASSYEDQSVIQEQISDTVAEGTIDVKLKQKNRK